MYTSLLGKLCSMKPKYFGQFIIALFCMLLLPNRVEAVAGDVLLGIHILEPEEVEKASEFIQAPDEHWSFVTVPIRLDQMDKNRWQRFFDKCEELHIIPLIRLATVFDKEGVWRAPTEADVIKTAQFLTQLNWPTHQLHVILYNEPNHAKEWGGKISPEEYSEIAAFAADWFATESKEYIVLPAGLDAEAPNGPATMESSLFIRRMVNANPDILDKFDAWNSHSYPNPAFSASAYSSGKNRLDGWRYELNFLQSNYGKEFDVYITETGWDQSNLTEKRLSDYYYYALTEIWNDHRVKAVTPFILQGNNGVFDDFSFINLNGSPTKQMEALETARNRLNRE